MHGIPPHIAAFFSKSARRRNGAMGYFHLISGGRHCPSPGQRRRNWVASSIRQTGNGDGPSRVCDGCDPEEMCFRCRCERRKQPQNARINALFELPIATSDKQAVKVNKTETELLISAWSGAFRQKPIRKRAPPAGLRPTGGENAAARWAKLVENVRGGLLGHRCWPPVLAFPAAAPPLAPGPPLRP